MNFGSVGLPELLIVLVVILLIFGPRRLPEMAKGIGQAVREFRKGIRDMKEDIDRDDSSPATPTTRITAETSAPQPETEKPAPEAKEPVAAGSPHDSSSR